MAQAVAKPQRLAHPLGRHGTGNEVRHEVQGHHEDHQSHDQRGAMSTDKAAAFIGGIKVSKAGAMKHVISRPDQDCDVPRIHTAGAVVGAAPCGAHGMLTGLVTGMVSRFRHSRKLSWFGFGLRTTGGGGLSEAVYAAMRDQRRARSTLLR